MCPYKYTLGELWSMQIGFKRTMREHALNQACLVWEDGTTDIEAFISEGIFHKSVVEKVLVSRERDQEIKQMTEEAKKHGGLIQVKPKSPPVDSK